MQTLPRLCVSATQVIGWCDHKVADVVWAVAKGSDALLYETLVEATLEGGLLHNFLPLPFSERSSYGRRLMEVWKQVQETYPDSEIARTFVWKFWQPQQDADNAHLLHETLGVAWMLPVDAKARAFARAGVQFH